MTNAFIQMSGVFAELELRIIRERVRSGMRNAKAKGAKIGRPQTTLDDIPANFLRHYPAYKNGVFNLTELSRLCDISRTTAYKYISIVEQQISKITNYILTHKYFTCIIVSQTVEGQLRR